MPFSLSLLSDFETPISLFHKLCADTSPFSTQYACLLESSDGDSRLARNSFIGVDPLVIVSYQKGQLTQVDCQTGESKTISVDNPLQYMKQFQEDFLTQKGIDPVIARKNPLNGGWIGYLGYGMTAVFDHIPQQTSAPYEVPDLCFGFYDTLILFDHLLRKITLQSYRSEAQLQTLLNQIEAPLAAFQPIPYDMDQLDEATLYDDVKGPLTKEEYCQMVRQCKDWITEGQAFQIVVAQRFSVSCTKNALTAYRVLQALNPSPYAYLLKFPNFSYIGSSPEMLVRCAPDIPGKADLQVTLKALAGTRPRGKDEAEDEALVIELKNNEKEMAEHRMLVDLARNDLGRVSQVGSIQVGEIATITKYTHVMHLATEVQGTLKPELTAYEVLKSCFPRGTVSGAPKIRAMQLLAQIEPERRGIYAGAVGYIDLSGKMDTAIAIRSALLKDGIAHVNAGAGVVYDSDPIMEFEETRNKAKSMIKALKLAEQLN